MQRIREVDLEKLDKLSFRIGTRKNMKASHHMVDYFHHYYHPESNPYKLADRIAKNNIGKSFDLAFSYYCKKVKIHEQKIFLEKFAPKRWRYSYKHYAIEEGLIIFINTRPKKSVTFSSLDYKTEKIHKGTGIEYDYFEKEKVITNRVHPMWRYPEYKDTGYLIYRGKGLNPDPSYKWIRAKESDFVFIVISGYAYEFTSRKDYRYQRLVQERIKVLNKKPKRATLSDYDFRRLLKEKELKEKQENLIKIISHGFDPLTSFRK